MRTIPREVCLSETQKAVLVGTLLGDGAIKLHGKNARLHIKHSRNQLPLVLYKYFVFANFISMDVNVFEQRVGKKDYKFAEFVTHTHPEFTAYYDLFYPSFKKIVPANINVLLSNPLSFAVWIMDDGSAEYAGLSIQTHSFTAKDVQRLQEAILTNFEIETLTHKNKGRDIIYFPKQSLSKLRKQVFKFILPEFKYKFLPYSARIQTP
ncbi:hypothetical protein A2803_03480 [Candidatus Woesebacteria bacterium RIFCSPHIGHO2_01_FULL_44_21]|uniref:Homing endonuclease LAGLIDADG domain-containing protein n=1 Tax=Candidatus Woesebacteria bacterium RIFCSPHIGHO2_01_FULL_44_21 TaxID=1802503 RepID=A0A1F7YYZ6_9BACT|nr:MAG: hypothetical protein A2803_03480 [Candidatus Woesebacteria bacterium RIFCSPHIGHO2_01_FULL_44_21]OGM69109.1 MAG: hypothetical protein A2897_04760 [Candidatus Woesebacteria bacterium RIFCSPLOWO2_01_FULL_44_24b]